jgi:hypothetical protein
VVCYRLVCDSCSQRAVRAPSPSVPRLGGLEQVILPPQSEYDKLYKLCIQVAYSRNLFLCSVYGKRLGWVMYSMTVVLLGGFGCFQVNFDCHTSWCTLRLRKLLQRAFTELLNMLEFTPVLQDTESCLLPGDICSAANRGEQNRIFVACSLNHTEHQWMELNSIYSESALGARKTTMCRGTAVDTTAVPGSFLPAGQLNSA